jgi:hypothetical protein
MTGTRLAASIAVNKKGRDLPFRCPGGVYAQAPDPIDDHTPIHTKRNSWPV